MARTQPRAPVAVWTIDEHRVGLKPILRRVWHKRGQQPLAPCRPRYQWLYEYAFVHPVTGETFWLLLPTVSTTLFAQALAQFATALGVGPALQVVLVLDQAGWHRSHDLVVPDGLTLVVLPPYSPELQPAERVWALSDEPLANRVFASLDDLETVLSERCRELQAHPELVAGRAHFHWWPDDLLRPVA
ncbi:MAG TPA: IS630 family transposase [Chloroflexota bacterium]|nr:IS630 family transposase [Chloroflexota bacterium]